MSQIQPWNLPQSRLWKWGCCCAGQVLLFLEVPTFPKESPHCSQSSLCAAASLLSPPAVVLDVLHPSRQFSAGASLGAVGDSTRVAVPFCWPGLWECSTEVLQEVQGGAVCLSDCVIPAFPYHSLFGRRGAPLLRPPPRGKSPLTLA